MRTHRLPVTLGLLVAALSAAGPSREVALAFDPALTEVDYTVGSVLHTFHGTFHLQKGDVRFDPSTGKASGELIVEAASGNSGSDGRDSRMHKDILESARYPQITFRPQRFEGKLVAAAGTSRIEVQGIFRIHGVDHEMTLPVEVKLDGDDYRASTTFDVPYVRWGMKNPSTLFLRVKDTAKIAIQTTAHVVR